MTTADTTLVVFPIGQLSKLDKARLEQNGIIAVEAIDPHLVIQIPRHQHLTQSVITGDALISAAVLAITKGDDTATYREFFRALNGLIRSEGAA